MNKIVVCEDDKHYFLRIHFKTREGEVIRFETTASFSKREADFRAVSLAAIYGWDRDELLTHPKIEPYPK